MVKNLADQRRALNAGNDVQGRTNAAGAGCAGAATRSFPPQSGQFSISMANTRLRRVIQVMGASGLSLSTLPRDRCGTIDPESVVLENWGMVTFQFGECNDASYTWEAPAPYDTGGFELIRLPALKNIFC